MTPDGYAGPPDNRHILGSLQFWILAAAGTPDGSKVVDPETGAFALAFSPPGILDQKSSRYLEKFGIRPAKRPDSNLMLSYAGVNIHRYKNYQVYTRGSSRYVYHTQYVRKGFLFYNIGGLEVSRDCELNPIQKKPGGCYEGSDGYNFSLAPAVTSMANSS